MSKTIHCGRCGTECLDYAVRSGMRECIACVGTELDQLLRAIGRAMHGQDAKPGKRTALRYVEQLAQERDEGIRKGFLEAAAHCEGYAAVVADDPDDLEAEGPHEVHVSIARHLARELREIAKRTPPAKVARAQLADDLEQAELACSVVVEELEVERKRAAVLQQERDSFRTLLTNAADQLNELKEGKLLELEEELVKAEAREERLRGALEMVRDADDDCARDGLARIPGPARARIDAALEETGGDP